MLAANRAAAEADALEAWRAALVGFAGSCRACLDTGRDYRTRDYCGACAEGGAVRARELEAEERRTAQRITLAYEHALAGSRLPPDYDALTLDTYPRQGAPALHDIRRYLERYRATNERRGMVLYGPYGTGKTALACAVMRAATLELCRRDPSARFRVRFYPVASLLRSLRAAMSSKGNEYAAIMADVSTARLLILDDVGRTNPGEWASEVLFDVINARYNAGLPLIVTTNYAEARLLERLGEHGGAIVDRIAERCIWINLPGSSLRKRATM